MSSRIDPRSREHLYLLQETLSEAGLESELTEASEEIPLDILVVTIEDDEDVEGYEEGDGDLLAIGYMPGTEEYYPNTMMLQLLLEVPIEVNPDNRTAVMEAMLRMNQNLGLGSYHLDEDDLLGFRHVVPHAATEPITKELIAETIELFLSMYHFTVPALMDINEGDNVNEVMEDLFG